MSVTLVHCFLYGLTDRVVNSDITELVCLLSTIGRTYICVVDVEKSISDNSKVYNFLKILFLLVRFSFLQKSEQTFETRLCAENKPLARLRGKNTPFAQEDYSYPQEENPFAREDYSYSSGRKFPGEQIPGKKIPRNFIPRKKIPEEKIPQEYPPELYSWRFWYKSS